MSSYIPALHIVINNLNKVCSAANRMYKLRIKTAYGTQIAIHAIDQENSGTNLRKKIENSVSHLVGSRASSIIANARVINVSIIK